ncbi:c-type cytochrome biogenesis protein CcmI [Oceanisphaera sediminis]|uniref:c-type cytochrome biogenesis protein CcmI n=1 Tax=Oceanisphaera sediminis TaxID=981381 RepID=UPI0031E93D91
MNLIFLIIAALLIGSATLWLCAILWRGPKQTNRVERGGVNTAVLRDQWAELERDHAHGTISANDLADARADLQRRALDEATSSNAGSVINAGSRRSAIALAIVLPVAATLTYLYLGNPAAISPSSAPGTSAITQADVQAMVASLEGRLKQNPDDPAGWLMLARSYRHFGRYEEAANAFSNATNLVQTDPLALAEYAETLARTRSSGFEGEPTRLLERALSLSPGSPMPLTLAGAAAMQREDYPAAINYWGKLLEVLPPDSDAAKVVSESIEHARKQQADLARRSATDVPQ